MTSARLWTALRMGPRNQLLALEAVAALTTARLALARRSFAEVAAATGQLVAPDDPRAVQPPPLDAQRIGIRQVRWAIAAIAPHLPFRTKCLQQALAARAMLERRGISSVIHFGTMRVGEALGEGHVWLDAGGVGVTGFPVDPALTEIGCLVGGDQDPARS
ncbi:lasso peptide biosynthesis B2 protein [Sphingomonas qomolangmaensis]|uniref:Lasso peptide biosynthesis B2 protein n=1 Tax=Sphingomonas qomolangmaensis TaxID=2918765 RepID=A0ABY5L8R4_9SPHN|nr:lasso peptide biosynthesis B2 protein [Sphingomonas qomolangmaensis]UUL82448.1 lasso peptide biosynthesis B2 protein [Sphingomonas qomolangmaensis]